MSDLISRKAAILQLAHNRCGNEEWDIAVQHDIETIKQLPSAQPEQRWIPCTERLPEDGRYLVTRFDFVTNTCFLDILWYEKGVWWNRLYTGDFAVTAWTPLPEPYRGGEKE